MNLREINEKKEWNSFIEAHKPNTFLQHWEWGAVQKATGENVRHLGIFDGDNQVAAALLITVNAKRGVFYLCPHGPVLAHKEDKEIVLKELIQFARKNRKKDGACALRIAPLFLTSDGTKSLFSSLGFRSAPIHMHAELTWVLDISPAEDELLQHMRKTTRHAIRKAEKEGVDVDVSTNTEDLERFFPLYERTKNRHAFTPFPRSFIQKQFEVFKKDDHAYMVFARYNGEDVAGAILMHVNDTAFYYHGASKKLPAKIPAAQRLQWEAIKEAKRRGASRYNFWGIAPDDNPEHPFAGITIFKKGFGGKAYDYMHAQDLPLHPRYITLWLIDSYRRWKRGF